MPRQKYTITLSVSDAKKLKPIISKGVCQARTVKRAQILLNLNSTATSKCKAAEIAKLFGVSEGTINNIKKAYGERGIDCVFSKKRNAPPVESKITGEVEAHLIALVCHNPPEGYCKWTLRLLSEKMVQMKYIDSISHTAVGTVLKKSSLKPHLVEEWCIPQKQSALFIKVQNIY